MRAPRRSSGLRERYTICQAAIANSAGSACTKKIRRFTVIAP
jgi:hypothetical protein